MKKDIILAGVGGQGILSIAAALGLAARESGLSIRQSEVHGMSQRGGAVQAHLRLSSDVIDSDLIARGQADLILGMEPMEAIRYVDYLSADGWLMTNSAPFVNIDPYPDQDKIAAFIRDLPHHIMLDADAIARKCGYAKASNMVLLGVCVPFVGLDQTHVLHTIDHLFATKGERVMQVNRAAFEAGLTQGIEAVTYAG